MSCSVMSYFKAYHRRYRV